MSHCGRFLFLIHGYVLSLQHSFLKLRKTFTKLELAQPPYSTE